MGVVIKQSVQSSIVSYFGIGVGFVNTILLFPKMLSLEEIGLFKLLLSFCIILMPILQFNGSAAFTKFYPFYQKKDNYNSFITFFLLLPLVGFLLLGIAFVFWKDYLFLALFSEKSPLFINYSWTLLPLVFFFMFSNLLETILFTNLKSVFATFLKTVIVRVLTTAIVLLYHFDFINQQELLIGFISIYGIQFFVLGIYFLKLSTFRFSNPFRIFGSEQFKKIKLYILVIFIGGGGAALVTQIDSVMLASKLGLEYTGIYTIAFFIAVVIEIPRRSIIQIVSPLISQSIEKQDDAKLIEIYKKTAVNQFIAGGFVFLLIITSLSDIYNFIPTKENFGQIIQGMPVVFIVGSCYVIDMLMGCNTEIIHYSKLYIWNAFLIPLLAFMAIGLNILFLNLLPNGLIAVAMATFSTIVIHNAIRCVIIYKSYKALPFSVGHLKFLALLLTSGAIVYFIPDTHNKCVNIAINSAAVSCLIIGGTILLKVSSDFTSLCNNAHQMVLSKLKK